MTITPSAEPTTTAGSSSRKLFRCCMSRREEVDGTHQSSIPSPIATASEPTLIAGRDALRNLEAGKRIPDADAHADEALDLLGEAGKLCGPAGDHDLADAETAGLVLVELERRDELARERLNLPPHCVERDRRVFGGQLLGDPARLERQAPLQRLDLGRRAVERARERNVQRRSRPTRRRA